MRYRRLRIEGATYFFTVVTDRRRPLLGTAEGVQLLSEAIEKVQNRHPFELAAQVVLPDHLHAMWVLPAGDSRYSTRWRLIKEAFTRAYIARHGAPVTSDAMRARGEQAVWQRRFWEHTIRDDADFNRCLDYIHINPVRHGLVEAARDWPFSTFKTWVERGIYEPHWGSADMPPMPDWAMRHD